MLTKLCVRNRLWYRYNCMVSFLLNNNMYLYISSSQVAQIQVGWSFVGQHQWVVNREGPVSADNSTQSTLQRRTIQKTEDSFTMLYNNINRWVSNIEGSPFSVVNYVYIQRQRVTMQWTPLQRTIIPKKPQCILPILLTSTDLPINNGKKVLVLKPYIKGIKFHVYISYKNGFIFQIY